MALRGSSKPALSLSAVARPMLVTQAREAFEGASALTTVQVEEALYEALSSCVGEHVEVVMKALNKRGTTRLGGPVASVHKHGFVVGDASHRVFVAFSDLFCQAARVVDSPATADLKSTLHDLREAQSGAEAS